MQARETLTALLWELHEAAQDASNDPSQANLNRVRNLSKAVSRAIPGYQYERTNALRAAAGMPVAKV